MTDQTIATIEDFRKAFPHAPDRFVRRLKENDRKCWEWQGRSVNGVGNGLGHGKIFFEGAYWYVHRLSYTWAVGEIPDGALVLHECDNPPCCNPSHLTIGDQKKNMSDCSKRGRMNHVSRFGEDNPRSIITQAIADRIRVDPRVARIIASDYGISRELVSAIKTGRLWNNRQR